MPSFVKNDDKLDDFNIDTVNLSFLNEQYQRVQLYKLLFAMLVILNRRERFLIEKL